MQDSTFKMYQVDTGNDLIIRLVYIEYGKEKSRFESRSIKECLKHYSLPYEEDNIYAWLMAYEEINELK